jgi:hypothetical protein
MGRQIVFPCSDCRTLPTARWVDRDRALWFASNLSDKRNEATLQVGCELSRPCHFWMLERTLQLDHQINDVLFGGRNLGRGFRATLPAALREACRRMTPLVCHRQYWLRSWSTGYAKYDGE